MADYSANDITICLVGQVKEMHGRDVSPAEAFTCGNDGGTAKAEALCSVQEPFGQGFMVVTSVLSGEERDLVAFHGNLS